MTIEPDTLVHYHSRAFELIREFDYSGKGQRSDKPTGFWVSVAGESDWHSWCTSEEYGVENLAVPHVVTLADTANILRITSEAELLAFDAEYHVSEEWERNLKFSGHWSIDWQRLYGEFDGIIIAPYQWSQRHGDLAWYYGWDCASGCIWNLNSIAGFEAQAVIA